MLNVSPCGRNCSVEERNRFEAYDREHHVRATLIADLERRFAGFNLTFAIGVPINLADLSIIQLFNHLIIIN